jgi:mitogen-activated protein kinase 15
MHSAKLVHRDMKPANLLLNSECLMKVADFGLARSLLGMAHTDESDMHDNMTDYVATRWYRAPEILAGSNRYDVEVDLWSLGCIFAEMLGGRPVYNGTTTLNQIEKILTHLGTPEDLQCLKSEFADSMIRDNANIPVDSQKEKTMEEQRQVWKAHYSDISDDAADMLTRLLQIDPGQRITAKEGLTHPYCETFHSAEDEQEATGCVRTTGEKLGQGLRPQSDMDDNLKKCARQTPVA